MMRTRDREANNLLQMSPDEAEAAIDRWAVVLISQGEAREIFAQRIKMELAMARGLAATQRITSAANWPESSTRHDH
jgi:hypothetical protein